MANKRIRIMIFPAHPAQVFHAAQQAIATHTRRPVYTEGITVHGSIDANMWSWGENLSIMVEPDSAGARVTASSRSTLATQIVDYGRHRKNVEALQALMEQSLERAAHVISPG